MKIKVLGDFLDFISGPFGDHTSKKLKAIFYQDVDNFFIFSVGF